MTDYSAAFRRCLEDCDVDGMRRLWAHVSPHLPQPANDEEALFALHHARTQSELLSLKHRAYSHRWLVDNGYPSGLPDNLKPSAERIYPRIVEGVGISIGARSQLLKPVIPFVHDAMQNAVLDCYADSKSPDPKIVTARMNDARKETIQKLIGKLSA